MERVSTLVILGASGDLTQRFLLPGLAEVLRDDPGRDLHLIGSSRSDHDGWQQTVEAAFADHRGPAVDRCARSTQWITADVSKPEDWAALLAAPGPVAFYFALGADVTAAAVAALSTHDVPDGTALVVEKPLGHDEASARALNDALHAVVPPGDVFRVDHFLGMTAVRTMEALRFGNRVLEPIWQAGSVESIEVVFDEAIGLNDRGDFYDTTGAARDMIQSHLIQTLAVVLAEPPARTADRDTALADALASLQPAGQPEQAARRARYTAGRLRDGSGRQVPDYLAEAGVDPSSDTETLAQVALTSASPRWRGVPLTLRSGKALSADRMEIVLRFSPAASTPADLPGDPAPNALRIDLLDGSLALELNVGAADDPSRLGRITLSSAVVPSPMSEYGRVLQAVLDGDTTRAVPAEAAAQGWRILDPVLAAFADGTIPMETYPAGGPPPAGW